MIESVQELFDSVMQPINEEILAKYGQKVEKLLRPALQT